MNDPKTPLHESPQYLHAQLLGMRALLRALAMLTTTGDSFREEGLRQIELLRTVLLAEPVSDVQLFALDEIEQWLRAPR